MVPEVWEEQYRVRSYDTDPNGRASLTALYSYLLESAGNHATAGGFGFKGMLERGLVWVLTRFKLVVDRYPVYNESVRVETWGKGQDGLFYTRDYFLKDEAEGLLGKATSSWAVLSAHTHKPETGEIFIRHFPHRPDHHALAEKLQKLPSVEAPDLVSEYRVRFSDLDFNRHANSMRYVEWIMNSLDSETRFNRTFKSMEVNYLAEAKLGDEVLIRTGKDAGPAQALLSAISAKSDSRDIARARIELG